MTRTLAELIGAFKAETLACEEDMCFSRADLACFICLRRICYKHAAEMLNEADRVIYTCQTCENAPYPLTRLRFVGNTHESSDIAAYLDK